MLKRILDSPWLYFGLAGLLAIVAIASQFELHLPSRPVGTLQEDLPALRERGKLSVLFILIDTLRADHLSSYGYKRETSPLLDRIANYGVRFAHVQAQSSWTKASMASLWMAEYPHRTGVMRFLHAVPEDARLPAEILQEAGYTTAGLYRNGWVEANFGFGQGFDLYLRPSPVAGQGPRVERSNPSMEPLTGTDSNITDAALAFLGSHAHDDNPFMLYLHYMDVHQYVYDEISGKFGATYRDAYDNAIHWTDRHVGRLMDELDRLGILDDTIVVVASDHGEAFGEHGVEGHARNLYREVTETPLILSLPFRLDPGLVVPDAASNIDIWPTLFDLLGLPPMELADGRSLVPAMLRAAERQAAGEPESEARTAFADRPIFSTLDTAWARVEQDPASITSVVDGPYRLIYREQQPDQLELYDRSIDPDERRNLASELTEVAADLRAKVEAHVAEAKGLGQEAPEVEVDEVRRGQLQALGYVLEDLRPKRGQGKEEGNEE